MADDIASYGWALALGITILKSLLLLVALLVFVAFILLADRKIWAAVQLRRGPNVVGPFGLFQSFADLLKFILKEPTIPAGANKGVFLLAPLVTATLALAAWAVLPVMDGWAMRISMSVFFIFSRSHRSAFMASSWGAGHQTLNIRFSVRFVLPRKWSLTKSPSALW